MDLQGEFHSSLNDHQNLEIFLSPNESIAQPLPKGFPDYTIKPLPPIPLDFQKSASKMKENSQHGGPCSEIEKSPTCSCHLHDPIRPGLGNKSNSSPPVYRCTTKLPPPPKPPMSNSDRKILQLTGHDPRYDRTVDRYSEFLESSSSGSSNSGSVYSQPESEAKQIEQSSPDRRSSTHSEPVSAIIGTTHLKSSTFNTMGQRIQAYYPSKNAKEAEQSEDMQKNLGRTFSTEPLTIEDFLEDPKLRTGSKPEDSRDRIKDSKPQHLVPQPLVVRTKPKQRETSGDKSSIIANARDSIVWGIDVLTSPAKNITSLTKNKHLPILEEAVSGPISPKGIRRKPGKERLKNALDPSLISPRSEILDKKLPNKFSKPMRNLRGAPPRPNIISNVARAPAGPDTPAPKSGISMKSPGEAVQSGNEHFQEAFAKAKRSLRIQTAEEKRRESLKNKIVVVGVSDQSPGGCPLFLNDMNHAD